MCKGLGLIPAPKKEEEKKKSALLGIYLTTPACFWILFAWNIIFLPFTFSVCVSLPVRHVSHKQQMVRACFFIHSASLHILIKELRPFTFRIIIERFVLISPFILGICWFTELIMLDSFLSVISFSILLVIFIPS
jgi:hypothetical protein